METKTKRDLLSVAFAGACAGIVVLARPGFETEWWACIAVAALSFIGIAVTARNLRRENQHELQLERGIRAYVNRLT